MINFQPMYMPLMYIAQVAFIKKKMELDVDPVKPENKCNYELFIFTIK